MRRDHRDHAGVTMNLIQRQCPLRQVPARVRRLDQAHAGDGIAAIRPGSAPNLWMPVSMSRRQRGIFVPFAEDQARNVIEQP